MKTWPTRHNRLTFKIVLGCVVIFALLMGLMRWKRLPHVLSTARHLKLDVSLTDTEQGDISDLLKHEEMSNANVSISAQTSIDTIPVDAFVSRILVPVTTPYVIASNVTNQDLTSQQLFIENDSSDLSSSIAKNLNKTSDGITVTTDPVAGLSSKVDSFGLINITSLKPTYRLLSLNDHYFLDDPDKGAVYRSISVTGEEKDRVKAMLIEHYKSNLVSKTQLLKVNMSGVTAMTRQLMIKMTATGDPAYPAKTIGAFLGDADITHTSNEVSFKEGCPVSDSKFCSRPEFIKSLEASGIDLVELTGNHNNDTGSDANAKTITAYKANGWQYFGGGLNQADAAKPAEFDQKGSKLAFLGYNYYDTIHPSVALAGPTTAGANNFSFDKIKTDIESAHAKGQFAIVDLQYQECYAYPDGFVIYPACYKPIEQPDQKTDFRRIIDLGADMVIGTQAHQPQTYELYGGKSIYYGLGNLFFDQDRWPGTEQGIILSHYFNEGHLLQTKMSPTVYDKSYQPRLMTTSESTDFFKLLKQARP